VAISPISLRIPYTSEAFPSGTITNASSELSVTWDEILWAALTIGRPSTRHVLQHGLSSSYEAIFRISLIRMALEQYGPRAARLRRTSAFKELDPTEKGAITYFLGMTFCKLFASRRLATPWLLHLDIYKSIFPASLLGRSRPDLFGQQTGTGAWHAFETKGRASKPSTADRAKAKAQALRLVSVNGTACTLHIGAFTYFAADILNFYWIDPPPETKKPLDLPETNDGWRYYYEPIWSLWAEASTGVRDAGELSIPLPQFDLKIRVHPLLAPYFVLGAWARAQREMSESYEALAAEGFQPDGIKVECGPSWSARQSDTRSSASGSSV
jgi:hypothetical protein